MIQNTTAGLWREIYKVTTPSFIKISNKDYIERTYSKIAGDTTPRAKAIRKALDSMHFTWDNDIPKCRECEIILGEEVDTYEYAGQKHMLKSYYMRFLAKNKAYSDENDNMYAALEEQFGTHFAESKEYYELNTETAEYDVYVNSKSVKIHTGADGVYGYAFKYKKLYGHQIDLIISADMMTKEAWRDTFLYLFDIETPHK